MADDYQEYNPELEKNSGEVSGEQLEKAEEWEDAMSDAPEFSAEDYGEAEQQEMEALPTKDQEISQEEHDPNIANAAKIINFGINEAVQSLGSVEQVVEKIKNFVVEGREDPVGDLFNHLGIDTPEEYKKLSQTRRAIEVREEAFRKNEKIPFPSRFKEDAIEAINAMKNLIREVENSEQYAELREGAKKMGMGTFEYAIYNNETRDLTTLFEELPQWKKAEEEEKQEERAEVEKQSTGEVSNKTDFGGNIGL